MTREDRIKLIKYLQYNCSLGVAYILTDNDVDEIIRALEQQFCEDCISRQAVEEATWEDAVNGYRCSTCNACNVDKYPYCPNCGAKMQEVEENESVDWG